MSTAAQAILEEFRSLPATEQREVSRQILHWLDQTAVQPPVADPIRTARGMFAGAGLTDALLASRAEERRRG
jgi:hypothetical protein